MSNRFLASREATISDGYKQAILEAASQDAIKFDALNDLLPSPGTKGYGTVLRSIKTAFIAELQAQQGLARQDSQGLLDVLKTAIQAGNVHEVMPTAGQSAGGIHEVLPAAEIVRADHFRGGDGAGRSAETGIVGMSPARRCLRPDGGVVNGTTGSDLHGPRACPLFISLRPWRHRGIPQDQPRVLARSGAERFVDYLLEATATPRPASGFRPNSAGPYTLPLRHDWKTSAG